MAACNSVVRRYDFQFPGGPLRQPVLKHSAWPLFSFKPKKEKKSRKFTLFLFKNKLVYSDLNHDWTTTNKQNFSF